MNFNGGAGLPWSRLERILSGHPVPAPVLLPARADIVSNSQDSAGYKLADGPAFAESLWGLRIQKPWWNVPVNWA